VEVLVPLVLLVAAVVAVRVQRQVRQGQRIQVRVAVRETQQEPPAMVVAGLLLSVLSYQPASQTQP